MSSDSFYEEEAFGVLSSDEIYLDCILVRPKGIPDKDINALFIWVPRYPLTKTTLINCARHDIQADWRQGKALHLVFDLRGTGDSDGDRNDKNFDRDIKGLQIWAAERFGKIEVVLLGIADGHGQAAISPIRSGVIIEYYHYPAETPNDNDTEPAKLPLFYLSTPGNFSIVDDELCQRLARAGYEVFGLDPLRYLLHASAKAPLNPADQWADLEIFYDMVTGPAIIIGQPLSSGLAMLWASGVERIRGVIAIGTAQDVFNPWHIFDNNNPHNYFINRYLYRLSPRPIAFVKIEGHELGAESREIAAYFATVGHPRLAEKTDEVSPRFLLKLLAWIENELPVDEN